MVRWTVLFILLWVLPVDAQTIRGREGTVNRSAVRERAGSLDQRVDPRRRSRGTVIENYYYDDYRRYPYSYSDGYGNEPIPPQTYPYEEQYWTPYEYRDPVPYNRREHIDDNRERVRQRYFEDRRDLRTPLPTTPSSRRPSLSDRIQQESDMRRQDSQIQRDYIREESLRRY